ncbi:MAG: hypothetical protein GX148_05240 [Clostridiales bacterium]|jgi:hypothetical protein|nr:hypothetical protein [Clostridiales bacterium]
MTPKIKSEYREFIKKNIIIIAFAVFVLIVITAITPAEFWIGIKLFSALMSYDQPAAAEGIKGYIIVFVCLIIADRLFIFLCNKLRIAILKRANRHITNRFDDSESHERAYCCRGVFGETFDEFFFIIRELTFSLALAAFTIYINPYAGIPFVALSYITLYRRIKGKPVHPIFALFLTALLVGYIISLAFLIVVHAVPYGGILGIYSLLMLKYVSEKDIFNEVLKVRINLSRLELLNELFDQTPYIKA